MKLKQFLDSLTSEQLVDRLNLALDGASLGIWDWDLRDNSVQFDRRWCEMLGLSHEATPMTLATWEDRVHPDDLAQCFEDIQAYLAGNTELYENVHRMRHANGEWVYILDRGRISGWDAEGKPIRFTGTHFDCTATERAKRVVEQQQQLLADMIHNVPTAVAMFDRDDRYVAASDEWRKLYRLPDREFIGRAPGDSGLPLPTQWDAARDRAHDGGIVATDADAVLFGGVRRVFRWSMRPWRASGEVAGIVVTTDDISGFVREREERERESRLSVLGLMAGGVAHEINSPLQAMLVNTQMVREQLRREGPDMQLLGELNDELEETTRQIGRVVTALRTMSRDGSGDPTVDVDATSLAAEVADLCRVRFRTRGIRFEVVDELDGTGIFRGRAGDTGQILLNLLGNAVDAVGDAEDPWIKLYLSQTEAALIFRVVDSGPGVPDHRIGDLMTPFLTTKPLGKGSGLGLSISRSLAAGQGATLRYLAEAEHTTFELSLLRSVDRQEAS